MANPNPSPATRFQPGSNGRPKASRDRLTRRFIDELAADFEANGREAIVAVRESDPASYLRVVASLAPKELEITRPEDGLSDEQLEAVIETLRAELAGSRKRRARKDQAQEQQVH